MVISEKIRVIITDDSALIRESLDLLLKQDNRIEVIAHCENGKKLLEQLKQQKADVVLLDIDMPIMNGKEVLEATSKRFPDVAVIMLSMCAETRIMADFISCGAKAFLSKGCNAEDLFEAIYTVNSEGFYFNKSVSRALLEGYLKEKSVNPEFSELALSKREKEILTELCDGKTNKQIAHKLNITPSTVDFHRGRIYRKTKSKNLAGIVKYAVKHSLVEA